MQRVRNLILTVAAVLGLLFVPAVANAADTGWSSKPMYDAPNQSSGYLGAVDPHRSVSLICWTDSAWFAGTNRWFLIQAPVYSSYWRRYFQTQGWMSANHISNQYAVRHC